MSAEAITASMKCRECCKALTLEELHYYATSDGTATCEECEGAWMEQVAAFKRGEREFPFRSE